MSRKKKIVKTDDDGTPLEIVEVDDDSSETQPPAVEPEPEVVPEPEPAKPVVEGARKVKWTKTGADRGAFSEHGKHEEGEIVETVHADLLIQNGFAEDAGE